jgi:hypothetical protein
MTIWQVLIAGYLLSVAIETPILVVGLSRNHAVGRRVFAGIWLTACTYPVVILVLPPLLYTTADSRWSYLLVAEVFAPVAECLLFRLAFGGSRRDYLVIVAANLASFGAGEAMTYFDGWRVVGLWL